MPGPMRTDRTTDNTIQEHLDDHNAAHGYINSLLTQAGSALQPGSVGFADLKDVNLVGLASGQTIQWSGTKWVPVAMPGGSGGAPGLGTVVNASVSATAAIDESKLNLASDAAAGVASRRTLGTGALQAAAGNDARFSDTRTPTAGTVIDASVGAAAAIAESKLNLASDAAAGVASRRTLGSGATQAAPGAGPFAPSMTGATAASRYVGGETSGSPTSGTFAKGDYVISQDGLLWICTTAGTPGTWVGHAPVGAVTPSSIGTAAAGVSLVAARADHVHPQQQYVTPGASIPVSAATRYVGATASGAPTAGTWAVGDFIVAQNGHVWICTTAGSPGTWTDASIGVITNHTYGLTSAAAGTKIFGVKMAASQTADPFDVVDSTDVQKMLVSSSGLLRTTGGAFMGTGAIGSSGGYVTAGDFGDNFNAYIQAAHATATDYNLLIQAKGNGRLAMQNSAGTDLVTMNTPGASTDTPLGLRINSTTKPVTVGAADSGGTGYRYLRVPN